MRAHLIPPEAPIELALESALALHRKTRTHLKHRVERFKQRASAYISRRYERAGARGYEAGLEKGKAEFADLTRGISQCYQEASQVAAQEAQKLGLLLADQIVEAHISQHPESLLAWFDHAAALLRTSAPLILLTHPRLHKSVEQITHLLPSGLRIEINSSPGAPDFTLTSDSGAVEFSWREALEVLTLSSEISEK